MSLARAIARWRVPLGFAAGAAALWLARPTWTMLAAGGAIALAGEALRVWAAGHVEKSREVTTSGPYRWTRHPLYVGSSLIGLGLAVASNRIEVATLALVYLGVTLTSAIRAEEAHLREKFGEAYDAYVERRHAAPGRAWSWRRAVGNREHHTMAGLIAGWTALAARVVLGGP